MSRQIALVVFGCCAYAIVVVIVVVGTASIIAANKIVVIFCMNVFTGPSVYIVDCRLPLSLISDLIIKWDYFNSWGLAGIYL
jgi:hypothetical protein